MEYVARSILKDEVSNDRKSFSVQETELKTGVNSTVVKRSKMKVEILSLNLVAYSCNLAAVRPAVETRNSGMSVR